MSSFAPLPPFAAIVVAAGKGSRVGGDVPKQFRLWHGKMLARHSLDALIAAGANPIVLVHNEIDSTTANDLSSGLNGIIWAKGGATRQDSVPVSYTHLTLPTIYSV